MLIMIEADGYPQTIQWHAMALWAKRGHNEWVFIGNQETPPTLADAVLAWHCAYPGPKRCWMDRWELHPV